MISTSKGERMDVLCAQPSLTASEARYMQSLLDGSKGIEGYEAACLRAIAVKARNSYALQLLVTYGPKPEYTSPKACALGLALQTLWPQGFIILLENEGHLLDIPPLCHIALKGESPLTLNSNTIRACDAAGNSALAYCVIVGNITLFETLISHIREEPDAIIRELFPMQLITQRGAREYSAFSELSTSLLPCLESPQVEDIPIGSMSRYNEQQQYELHDTRRFRAAKRIHSARTLQQGQHIKEHKEFEGSKESKDFEESEESDPYVLQVRQMYSLELARGGSLRGACYTARALLEQVKALSYNQLVREYWDTTLIPTTSLTVLDFELYSLESGLISELGAVKMVGTRPIFALQGFIRPTSGFSNTSNFELVVSITGIEYRRTEETQDAYDALQFLDFEDHRIFEDLQAFIHGSILDLQAWVPSTAEENENETDETDHVFTTLCHATLPDLIACRTYTRPSGLRLLHFRYSDELTGEHPPLRFDSEIPIVLGKGVNTERECLKALGIPAELIEIQQFFAPTLTPQAAEGITHQEVAPSRLYCAGHRALLATTRRTPALGHFHCALDDCLQYLLAIRKVEREKQS